MHRLAALLRNRAGSVAVEFALIGPALLGLLFGVLHIGIAMQSYNALRGISADVARIAVVNYQTDNRISTDQLQDIADGIATRAPYGLAPSRFIATMTAAGTQRVAGASEYSLTVTYRVPTLLQIMGISEFPISYTRPVFVTAPPAAPSAT